MDDGDNDVLSEEDERRAIFESYRDLMDTVAEDREALLVRMEALDYLPDWIISYGSVRSPPSTATLSIRET